MKYLKSFEEESEYQEFVDNDEMILPNVSYIEESDRCAFNPVPKVTLNYNCPEDNSLAFSTGIEQIKKLTINGENIDLTQIQAPYYFEAAGEYTVEIELLNENFISMFDEMVPLTSVIINRGVTSIGEYAFRYCSSLKSIIIPDSVTSIGYEAFYDCSSLKSITIPDSVTTIESYTFQYCTSLTSIIIPDSVTTIDDGAFSECSSLTSIIIPDSVTSIGAYAFSYCISLTSITIPYGVTTIKDCTFDKCYSLTSITIPNSVTSIGYEAFYDCSSLASITIPDSVTTIDDGAFSWCSSLKSITCNSTVAPDISTMTFQGVKEYGSLYYPAGSDYSSWLSNSSLGYYKWNAIVAKYNVNSITEATKICHNTSSFSQIIVGGTSITPATSYKFTTTGEHEVVYILNGTSIEEYEFQSCTSLTSITIPDIVTSIGASAFFKCSSLVSITIPDSVTSIGMSAFNGCYKLESITIPDGVNEINHAAFYNCTSLISITIPNSVTAIGTSVFYGCTSLKSITIPYGVTSIGASAFSICTSLASITIPDSVTSIGADAFFMCSSLVSITIPDSVTTIGASAFYDCSSLASITIPDSVTSIGTYAFAYCSSLTSITCNATVAPTITNNTFLGVKQYGSLYYPAGSDYSSWLSTDSDYLGYYNWNKAIVAKYNVTNTTGNTTICHNTSSFSKIIINGTSITPATSYKFTTTGEHEVVYVLNGTTIEYDAFYNCTSLASITIPDIVTSIGASAFSGCDSLTSITIPDSVTSIGASVFNSCTSLKSITIPDGVNKINYAAFYNCTSLTSITIPDSVTTIGNYAFLNCNKLESITIPYGVTSIGNNAFDSCYSLSSITIPDSVTTIGEYAFSYCSSLASITCNATVAPTITNNTFIGVKQYGSLYYPAGSDYSSWLSTDSDYLGYYNWNKAIVAKYNVTNTTANTTICYQTSSFSQIIVDGTATPMSTVYKFTTTGEHEVVYILNGTTIGSYAFQYCVGMTTIDIPNSVTSIGTYAFAYCNKLESITIPDSVTSIGTYAFAYCSSLTSITCNATVAPTITNTTFVNGIKQYGSLHYPAGSDYSSWLSDSPYYLGYYNWNKAIVAKYNVNSITEATKICHNTSSFSQIIVGGTSITPATSYEFTTTGEHEVVYVLNGTTIGNNAFQNCNQLTSITIPNIVTSIGGTAFYGCTLLASITIPNSVTTIGNYAFQNCNKLESITIPDGVNKINHAAFYNCTSLTSITIPNSVTSIGNYAFANCTKLTSITCIATIAPTIFTNTFYNVKRYGSLHYPAESDYSSWLYYLGYYNWKLRYI